MIKITHVRHVEAMVVELQFSDGSSGEHDLSPVVKYDTVLTRPLTDPDYFRSFFIELGALAWANGLELSGNALHSEMLERGELHQLPLTARGS